MKNKDDLIGKMGENNLKMKKKMFSSTSGDLTTSFSILQQSEQHEAAAKDSWRWT